MTFDDDERGGPKLIDPRRKRRSGETARVDPHFGNGDRPSLAEEYEAEGRTEFEPSEPEDPALEEQYSEPAEPEYEPEPAPEFEAAPEPEPEASGTDKLLKESAYRVDVMRAFRAQIEPHLASLGSYRRQSWIIAFVAMAAISLGVYVGVRILGGSFGLPAIEWVAPTLALALGLPIGYAYGNWRYSNKVRKRILPMLCDSIGGVAYHGHKRRGFGFGTFQSLALIDRRLRLTRLEDRFSGTYRNTDFQMMEAVYRPSKRTKTEDSDPFLRGILIRLSVPMPFNGTTMVGARADKPVLPRLDRLFGKRRLRPVEFDDPVFQLHYHTRSDDPEEAHRLVAPVFRNAMLAMTNERQGEIVRAAFHKGEFWMSVPVWRPLFEIASLMTSTRQLEERTMRAADEITVVHRVIDQLHGSGPMKLL